jgi:hypothetical protein
MRLQPLAMNVVRQSRSRCSNRSRLWSHHRPAALAPRHRRCRQNCHRSSSSTGRACAARPCPSGVLLARLRGLWPAVTVGLESPPAWSWRCLGRTMSVPRVERPQRESPAGGRTTGAASGIFSAAGRPRPPPRAVAESTKIGGVPDSSGAAVAGSAEMAGAHRRRQRSAFVQHGLKRVLRRRVGSLVDGREALPTASRREECRRWQGRGAVSAHRDASAVGRAVW